MLIMTIPRKTSKRNTSNKVGSTFESKLINLFEQYRKENKAYLIKVPTETTIIRKGAKIVNAIHRSKSDCLDFIGFLKDGKPIVFEAKTTKEENRFPLSNIAEYQYELADELYGYIDNVFYIVEFRSYDEVYLVHANKVKEFKENSTRKSIPYSEFKNIGILMDDLDVLKYL
ncbi:MAG: Holliday junction resolvase RecU [Cetobacterium sp.]